MKALSSGVGMFVSGLVVGVVLAAFCPHMHHKCPVSNVVLPQPVTSPSAAK